ncbi:Tubulin/FtsZ family, GTPase domain-containing protein, partial [Blyttiomyces helicus]
GATGRGNNWAHGYMDTEGADATVEGVRRCVEVGSREAFMIFHSIAGGTGSGLGSRVAEELRHEFPKGCLMSCAIAPFLSGETALQHYNSLLSLGWMQNHADTIGIFPNDATINCISRQYGLSSRSGECTCSRRSALGCTCRTRFSFYSDNSDAGPQERISVGDLNEYIGHCLADVILPFSAVRMAPFDLWELIYGVTPMPLCKVAHLATSRIVSGAAGSDRTSTMGWDALATALGRNMPPLSVGAKRKCIGAQLNARGVQGPEYWDRAEGITGKFSAKLGMTLGATLASCASSIYALNSKSTKRSLSLVYNSSDAIPTLEGVLTKARAMYEGGAYLHWYRAHGGEDVDGMFEESFETVQTALDGYYDFCGG